MIKENGYSILGILSPFLGVGLIVLGVADNYFTGPLSLLIGVVLGLTFAIVSLFKKEKKMLSFISLGINVATMVFGPVQLF